MLAALYKTSGTKSFFSSRSKNRAQLTEERGQRKGIALYHADNIDQCPLLATEEGRQVRSMIVPLIKRGVTPYIANIRTDLRLLVWDDLVMPVTINDSEYENSYVCSPYSYYISYAKESLVRMADQRCVRTANNLLWGIEKILLRCQVNKAVIVNNWPYSTNVYPALSERQIEAISEFLKMQFPEHALIFRSVDPCTNPDCHEALQKIGYRYIASRQIFFIKPWETTLFSSRLFKCDMKILEKSGYALIDGEQIKDDEIPRLLELYRGLFIDKFSTLNPQFTEEFFRLALKENTLFFKGLKKEGRIDGIVGYMERNGTMFCPIFGYDRSLPEKTSLYRLLSTLLMLEADRKRLLFHQSSGASMFKKIRKAKSCIEYLAVDFRHLPLRRKIPWLVLEKISNSLGIVLMKRY